MNSKYTKYTAWEAKRENTILLFQLLHPAMLLSEADISVHHSACIGYSNNQIIHADVNYTHYTHGSVTWRGLSS